MANFGTAIVSAFGEVKTELICFCLAFATHFIFYKFLRNRRSFNKGKEASGAPLFARQKNMDDETALRAFKAAIHKGDAHAAMASLDTVRSLWEEKVRTSPSAAPQMLMEQLVKLAVRAGSLSELLQQLTRNGLLEFAFDIVLAECAEKGDVGTVKKVENLGRAHSLKFTSATYRALILVGSSAAGRDVKLQDLQAHLSAAESSGVADPTVYNAFLQAAVKVGSRSEVISAIQRAKAAGCQPDVKQFNKLMGGVVASDAALVWTIFDEMQASGVKPDQTTCSILLKSRNINSKNDNLEKVVAILDGLNEEMDEVLFCSLVDAYVRLSRADLLVRFLAKYSRLPAKNAHTFANIIRAYGYVQNVKGMWDTWVEMRKQHIAPTSVALGCMVEALVTNGNINAGYELIHDMLKDEKTASAVNAVMYGSIVKGYSHNKDFARMWEVYDEMVAQKLQFSMVTYNTLIDACARSGELSRIPSLLTDIKNQGLEMGLVTYSAILKGYCQKNLIDEAFELFEDVQNSMKLQPDEIMFNTLLDGCARQGLFDRGMAVLEKMEQAGIRPTNYTLSVLVKLANRGKKLDRAFELCEEVSSKHNFKLNVHVFDNLIQACINHRDLQKAIGVLDRMLKERVRPDERTYSLLLKACVDGKEPKEADGLVRSAFGLRKSHPRLAKYSAAVAKPQGGLSGRLVSEILVSLIDFCREERLASSLFSDLSEVPGLQLDSKLRLRLTARIGARR